MHTYEVDVPLQAYITIKVKVPDGASRVDIFRAITRDHLHDAWCEGDGYQEKIMWDAQQIIKNTYNNITLDNFSFYEVEDEDEDEDEVIEEGMVAD